VRDWSASAITSMARPRSTTSAGGGWTTPDSCRTREEVSHRTGDRFSARQAIAARCYLVEKLSGVQARRVSTTVEQMNRHELVTSMRAFRKAMSVRRATLLDVHAQRFLAELDIDKPVQWHPPLELLDGLGLPEPTRSHTS
jgi:hypothetical protein